MRILFIENDNTLPYLLKKGYVVKKPTGGASIELEVIIKELIKSNEHDIGLVSWIGSKAFIGKDLNNELEVFEASTLGKRHRLNYMFRSFISVISYRPDFIFIKGNGLKIPFFMICAKLIGCKTVFRLSSDLQTESKVSVGQGVVKRTAAGAERLLYFFGLKRMNFLLCQNTYQYNKLRKIVGHSEKLHVVNDFIDCDVNIPASIESRGDKDYIAWVGRFAKVKNVECLLTIARKCPNVVFKVAGGRQDGNESELARSLSKLKNVELVGHLQRDEILSFISDARGVLITSWKEGFSRVILESLIVGTPLILTAGVDPDGIVKKNRLGIVKDSHYELTDGINELLALQDYKSMSDRCVDYVRSHHSIQAGISQILSILNEKNSSL